MSEGREVVRRVAARSSTSARWCAGERDQDPDLKAAWAAVMVWSTSSGEAEWVWAKIVPVEGSSIGILGQGLVTLVCVYLVSRRNQAHSQLTPPGLIFARHP